MAPADIGFDLTRTARCRTASYGTRFMLPVAASHGDEDARTFIPSFIPWAARLRVRTCAADLSRARHQSVFDATMASTQESGLRENCTGRLSSGAFI